MSFTLYNTNGNENFILKKTNLGGGFFSIFRKFITDNLLIRLDSNNKNSIQSNIWFDTSGNENNATIDGATIINENGGVFDFNGINNKIRIEHQPNLSLSTTTSKTFQLWIKIDVLPLSGQNVPFVGKISTSYDFDGFYLRAQPNNILRLVTNGTNINKVNDSSINTLQTNNWYFITVITKITNEIGSTKVYLNTNEIISSQHGIDGYSEQNPIYLGYTGDNLNSPYLNGKIGAFYFYNKALTLEEITQNYIATKQRFES